jgi:hypothetical protein
MKMTPAEYKAFQEEMQKKGKTVPSGAPKQKVTLFKEGGIPANQQRQRDIRADARKKQRPLTAKIMDVFKGHNEKKKAESAALRALRAKSAPLIGKIAKEYGASVDILDKTAFCYKTVKGEERRVHIPYGLDADDIRNRMDRAFLGSSTKSKIKSAVKTVKGVHKALKDSGMGTGNMWGDPKNMYK